MVRKNPIKKKFLDGVPTPKHLMGGYIGEKEIKSAGNKIYKIINTPEAQNLGKAALMTLITGAIGSTIHSGLSSTPEVSPPAGAPPPVREPDELDTNPMLHWAGLGLGKGIKEDIKEGYKTKIEPAIKSAGDAIYKLITSPDVQQSLGKAGLGLLILLAVGSQGEKIANFGNEMAIAGLDYNQDITRASFGREGNKVPEDIKHRFFPKPDIYPDFDTRVKNVEERQAFNKILQFVTQFIIKNPNFSGRGIIKDIHNHVKGGAFEKTKKTLKATSNKIYNAITSKGAQNLGKVAILGLITLAIKKGVDDINANEAQMAEYERRYRNTIASYRPDELDVFNDTSSDPGERFSHFAGNGLPKHMHRLSTKMADSIEYLKNKKIDKKYLPFLISNILSAGVLVAKGGNVSKTEKEEKKEHHTIWNKYIKPASDKIYDVITSDEAKTAVKGVVYLLLSVVVADQVNKLGVAINRGLTETLTQRRNATSQASRDLFNAEHVKGSESVPKGYKGEERPEWDDTTDPEYRRRVLNALESKYASSKAEEKHTKDALIKIGRDLGVNVSAKPIGRPVGSLGKSSKTHTPKTPVRIPAMEEESKGDGLHGGDFQNDTARIRMALSDSGVRFKNQLNKLYRDITSEEGKKISKKILLALAGLALTGATAFGVSKLGKHPEERQRPDPEESYDARMYREGFRDFL